MNGMRGYFAQFPDTDPRSRAMMLTTTFRFALGTVFNPDFDPNGDPRLDALFAVAELLDGVLFTPSSLRDARGRILFAGGRDDVEDPNAVWPKVIADFLTSEPIGAAAHEASRPKHADEDDEIAAPAAERVARRGLALTALTTRAILEQDVANKVPHITETYQDLLAWIGDIGISDELEPDEWEVLQRPPGRLDERQQIDSTWRLEGLVVLAWALSRFEITPHDQLVVPNLLWPSLGLFDPDAAKSLVANPTLRPRAEIATLRNRLFALHWRLRNFSLQPTVMNFAEFAQTCWFGPLDIADVPLVEGDLAIRGMRIDRVPPDLLSLAHSAIRERHQAANWLWEGPERYSEASQAT